MAKKKYYVVWKGVNPGIYNTWDDCQRQINGYKGAQYKSYPSMTEAEQALKTGYQPSTKQKVNSNSNASSSSPIWNSLSVDAACSGNPGVTEYQGVNSKTKEVIFYQKFPLGTNNIGEFLALVHGISYVQQKGLNIPIYTDSKTAMSWISKKKCGSKLEPIGDTQKLFELVERAEKWLQNNIITAKILKWDTKSWGEIPADFGRK